MTKQIVFDDLQVARYVAENAGCTYDENVDHSIGLVDPDSAWETRVVGGATYTAFTGSSCFVHVAGRDERWMTREFLALSFDYPFVQLGLSVLLAFVEEANKPALDFDLHLGFEKKYVVPDMFPSGAGVLLTMTRDSCRWLKHKPRLHKPAGA